jgi:hypothetical protein
MPGLEAEYQRLKYRAVAHAMNLSTLLLLGFVTGRKLPQYYQSNFDSIYNISAIENNFTYLRPSLFLGSDLMTSLGNVQFGINHWLNLPALFAVVDSNFSATRFLIVTLVCTYTAAFYLVSGFRHDYLSNCFFASLLAFLIGGVSPFSVSNFSRLQPSAPMTVVLFCFAFGSILRLRMQQGVWRTILYGLTLGVSILLTTFVYVGLAPIVIYGLIIACFALILNLLISRHFLFALRVGFVGLFSALFGIITGGIQYVVGYVSYSGQVVFGSELGRITQTSFLDLGTVFFRGWNLVSIIQATVVAGAILHGSIFGSGPGRFASRLALIVLAGNLLYHVLHNSWSREIGPLPAYMSFLFWAIYLIPITDLDQIVQRVPQVKWRQTMSFDWTKALLGLGLPLLVWTFLWYMRNPVQSESLKLTPQQLTLKDSLELGENRELRGRVALFMGTVEGSARNDDENLSRYLNTQLVPISVPVLDEYSHGVTAQFIWFTREFLVDRSESRVRGFVPIRRADLKILRMMGVTHLISTDHVSGSKNSTAYETSPRLISVIGNKVWHSPTKVVVAKEFEGIATELKKGSFDPSVFVVRGPEVAGYRSSFAQVSSARVSIENGAIRVQSFSEGESLLVLPIEFSNCLRLEGSGALVRVNGIFTGLEFSKRLDATLRYQYLPGLLSNCRLEDFNQYKDLRGQADNDPGQ